MEEIIYKFGERIYLLLLFNSHKRNLFCLHFYFDAQFSCEMAGVNGHYLCTSFSKYVRVASTQYARYPCNSYDFFVSWGSGQWKTLSIHVMSTQCASGLTLSLFIYSPLYFYILLDYSLGQIKFKF